MEPDLLRHLPDPQISPADLAAYTPYFGHRDPKHTVHYTRIAGRRFEGL